MKLSKRFKNSVYALLSFVALFLIFWIWSGGSILKIVKADWTKGMPNTNIDATSTNHWAWNDVIGWIDFYNTERVMVQSREIKGYASSSVGEISLNCDSSGNFGEVSYCGPPYNAPFKVKNDGGGKLSGWAWNDLVGWISFCGTSNAASSSDNCLYSEYTYGTALKWNDIDNNPPCGYSDDQPPSDFYGYAWNDIAGWISFNTSTPICPLPSSDSNYEAGYKVRSGWYATSTYGDVYSSIFDTGIVGGAQFN